MSIGSFDCAVEDIPHLFTLFLKISTQLHELHKKEQLSCISCKSFVRSPLSRFEWSEG